MTSPNPRDQSRRFARRATAWLAGGAVLATLGLIDLVSHASPTHSAASATSNQAVTGASGTTDDSGAGDDSGSSVSASSGTSGGLLSPSASSGAPSVSSGAS